MLFGVSIVIRRAQKRLLECYDHVFLTIAVDEHKGRRQRLRKSVDDVARVLGREVPR